MRYYLTIDNGGTKTKVVICDLNGQQVAVSAFPTQKVRADAEVQEIKLQDLLAHLGQAIRQALTQAALSAEQIAAVTVVGHGKGLYLLDRHQQIFHNGILSTDQRAIELAQQFEAQVTQIYPISQQHVMASQAPVLLAWLKQNQPAVYQQIGTVFSNKDFIRYLLTGEIYQEIGDASGNNLLNLTTQQYDERLLDFFGIPEIKAALPPLVQATTMCGHLTAAAAQVTGLKPQTPVFGGMFDIDACTLATGVLDESLLSMIAGTWNMNLLVGSARAPQQLGLMNSLFVTQQNLVEASSPTSAGNLALMIKMLLADETLNAKKQQRSIYDYLEDFLKVTDPSYAQVFFLPFLYGSNAHPDAQGALIGLRSNTSKSELIRAVYEGICFAHKTHVQQLLQVTTQPQVVRLSGGAVNSMQWMQMFADVLQLPVEIPQATELGGLGGAICCAVAQGAWPDFKTAVHQMTHVKQRFEPDLQASAVYQAKYQVYQELVQALNTSWPAVVQLQQQLGGTK